MPSPKLNVLLLCGGRSGEHDVSVDSARSVAAALSRDKYELVEITVGLDGLWRTAGGETRILLPVPGVGHLVTAEGHIAEPVDVILPLIHGTFGEDGCLQGLFELAELPYVGSGVLGSALGMDKEVQKRVLKNAGLPIVEYVSFRQSDWHDDHGAWVTKIEREIGYPNFVKPVNMGSSVGITKAHDQRELLTGVEEALRFDGKIIVERAVSNAREIECAVLGGHEPQASVLGEVRPSGEFYDYKAKYISGTSELTIPADLEQSVAAELRRQATEVFRCLEAEGLGRVDFLMDGATGRWIVNEINTLPGFTEHSMYPKLWAATGLGYSDLLDHLVGAALARAQEKSALSRQHSRQ